MTNFDIFKISVLNFYKIKHLSFDQEFKSSEVDTKEIKLNEAQLFLNSLLLTSKVPDVYELYHE